MYLGRGNPAKYRASGSTSVAAAATVSVLLLLTAGVAYRVTAPAWTTEIGMHVDLPVPLKEIPRQVGDWTGEDLEIPTTTQIYMKTHFADDYMSRRYANQAERIWADAYVVYCSTRLSGMLGHKPSVCYPGNGWIWDSTVPSQFTARSGRTIECLIHCFHKPAPSYLQVYVLNFYVLNGQITLREKDFSSLIDRQLNLSGDPARYVAQVQISSVAEYSIMALASQMADIILAHLPDQNGYVSVADITVGLTKAGGAVESDR